MSRRNVYLDNAATTSMDSEVVRAMLPYFNQKYGNPSSLHSYGAEAKKAMEKAREEATDILNAPEGKMVFTSGGTEANNLAIKGAALANRNKGKHIITTQIEHHCVLNSCKWLQKEGFDVTYVTVDKNGLVDIEELEANMRRDTTLVSVMHANNEIGTIQDIKRIAKIAHAHGAALHTDAVQSFGKIPVDIKDLDADMLTLSSHKIHGPKGVGLLYVKKGVRMEPIVHGGGHEYNLRSGTENIAGIVGMARAMRIAENERQKVMPKLTKMRDKLIKGTLRIKDSWLNGHAVKRLPTNANFGFKYIEGESLVLRLDEKGIAASTGSACSSHSLEPSHVMIAIGHTPEEAHSSLRFTLSKYNKDSDIRYALKVLPKVVTDLRKISPFKDSYKM